MLSNCEAQRIPTTSTMDPYGNRAETFGSAEPIRGDLVLLSPPSATLTPGGTEPLRVDAVLYVRPPLDVADGDHFEIDGSRFILAAKARRWDTGVGLAGSEILLRRWVQP